MQFSKSQLSIIALLVFTCLSLSSYAQSKMEYGIGIGLLYGDYYENSNLPEGFDFDIDEARFSPSVNGYLAYRITDRVKITSSPGINFLQHYEPFSNRELSAVYFHLPIGIQHHLIGDLSITAHLFYDYLANQAYAIDGEYVSVTDLADTRHLYGGSMGLAYGIGRYAEIQLMATHQFKTVNTFNLTDMNGDPLGNVMLKNRFLKFNLVFRG